MSSIDKKAKKILFSAFWKNGWVDNYGTHLLSLDDFLYAKQHELMFDPLTITHDELIKKIVSLRKKIPKNKAAKAFLSSLSSQRVDWRSAIASWDISSDLKLHPYLKYTRLIGTFYDNGVATPHIREECEVCGGEFSYQDEDLNVLNFERVRWGGVRHGSLIYTLLDLEQLNKADIPEPSQDDITLFKNILKTVETSNPKDSPGKLRDRLKDILPSTKDERGTLLEILACIDILKPLSDDRNSGYNDWRFIADWRGEDKFNQKMVNVFFGQWLSVNSD